MDTAQPALQMPPKMRAHAPSTFQILSEEDLHRIPFRDGVAAVELPARLLSSIDLKNDHRGDSPRLRALEKSIRSNGFQPLEPITARIGRKGRWVIVNGGHRLTAARKVMREFWPNLFGPKVEGFYFVLFLNPDSWRDVGVPDGVTLPEHGDSDMQAQWERAQDRMRQSRSQPLSD